MNYFFGCTLIPIKTFFINNNIPITGRSSYSGIYYSGMNYTSSEIYLKLLLNFSGIRGPTYNISIFNNNSNVKEINDITIFIYVHGYPYIWQYTPSIDEKKFLSIYNNDDIETLKMKHNDDDIETLKMKQNNDNIETLRPLMTAKFKTIYKQSKKFKKKHKKLKKRIKKIEEIRAETIRPILLSFERINRIILVFLFCSQKVLKNSEWFLSLFDLANIMTHLTFNDYVEVPKIDNSTIVIKRKNEHINCSDTKRQKKNNNNNVNSLPFSNTPENFVSMIVGHQYFDPIIIDSDSEEEDDVNDENNVKER